MQAVYASGPADKPRSVVACARQLEVAQRRSAPRAIEAPRPSLADLQALAADHEYDVVVRQEGKD